MKNKKYYIALNDREYAEIISSFITNAIRLSGLANIPMVLMKSL